MNLKWLWLFNGGVELFEKNESYEPNNHLE